MWEEGICILKTGSWNCMLLFLKGIQATDFVVQTTIGRGEGGPRQSLLALSGFTGWYPAKGMCSERASQSIWLQSCCVRLWDCSGSQHICKVFTAAIWAPMRSNHAICSPRSAAVFISMSGVRMAPGRVQSTLVWISSISGVGGVWGWRWCVCGVLSICLLDVIQGPEYLWPCHPPDWSSPPWLNQNAQVHLVQHLLFSIHPPKGAGQRAG